MICLFFNYLMSTLLQ